MDTGRESLLKKQVEGFDKMPYSHDRQLIKTALVSESVKMERFVKVEDVKRGNEKPVLVRPLSPYS